MVFEWYLISNNSINNNNNFETKLKQIYLLKLIYDHNEQEIIYITQKWL